MSIILIYFHEKNIAELIDNSNTIVDVWIRNKIIN